MTGTLEACHRDLARWERVLMKCSACGHDNLTDATSCQKCGSKLGPAPQDRTITQLPATEWAQAAKTVPSSQGSLKLGSEFGGRYQILQMLGEGGMGAVYKAHDNEVDRTVALKVIRPELAAQQEILNRFKQELILARQITHKNIIRIFDLGQAEGVKFITMEFVEGRDLHTMIRDRQPISLEQQIRILQQVCLALDAAHAEGVVHRDLKPHNILVEKETGRVVVMDFGIARSMEQGGMTMTGALIGTPAYMSPEQAKGDKIDTRSDLFSFGVIAYELLTGKAPYESETMVGTLMKRIQERPLPPIHRNKEIPQGLSDIILKCLTVDVEQRYQTAQEILNDLSAWQGSPATFKTVVGATVIRPPQADAAATVIQSPEPRPGPSPRKRALKWILPAGALVALGVAGFLFRDKLFPPAAKTHAPVTVIIADFGNHTGDAVFDGTLEPMLKIALEGAGFISAFDRTQVRRNLGVRPPEKLDEPAAREIAVKQGIGVVVSGSIDKQGSGYRLSIKAAQAVTGAVVTSADDQAATKDNVLHTAAKLAALVRKGLGDDTSESAQRFAMETLTATSLAAVHDYAVAMESLSNSRFDEARNNFSKAVDLDPNFGLAYAGMAIASRNLGQQQEAEKYIKLAVGRLDRMTERERYRTRGMFYYLTNDYQKCVEEYGSLIERYASDAAAHNNLALCSTLLRDMPKALDEMQRVVEILPKRVLYRVNLALYASYGGDFARGEREARAAQELNPSAPEGFLPVAFAQAGLGKLDQAADTYQKLGKINPIGASYAASGLADLAVYEGRFSQAVGILENGAAADLGAKEADRAAAKLTALAYAELMRGKSSAAVAAAGRALSQSETPRTQFLAARIFVEANQTARAEALAKDLGQRLQKEPQAYAKLIMGNIARKNGDLRGAINAMTEANGILDTWIGRFDLGRAYVEAGAFTEADAEFDRCIKRRGEALSLFLDEEPTWGHFPLVYYYQGRVREGLKSSGFAESYRTYVNIRGKAAEDPLLAEVRRRAGL